MPTRKPIRRSRLITRLVCTLIALFGSLAVAIGPAAADTPVTATPPTFTDPFCDNNNVHVDGTVTIPSETGVSYSIFGSTEPPGVLNVADGASIEVDASAQQGYQLSGQSTFDHSFSTVTCTTTAQAPTFNDDSCSGQTPTGASYVIPDEAGINYTINGAIQPSGTYAVDDGSSLTVTASAQNGYTLAQGSATTFSHTFSTAPDCKTMITADPPTFTDDTCSDGAPTGASYTIPSQDDVTYYVSINGGNSAPTAAGTYPVTDGASVDIGVSSSDPNAEFTGPVRFSHVYAGPPCTVEATPPDFHDASCDDHVEISGVYNIPDSEGVDYYVGSTLEPSGPMHGEANTTVTVTAQPQAGYALTGQTTFSHTFGPTPDCTTHVTAAAPTFTEDSCTAGQLTGSSYTIPAEEGVDYYVGSTLTAAGTYPAADGSTIDVTAEPQDEYSLDGTTAFSHTFAGTPTCPTVTAAETSRLAPSRFGWYRVPVTVTFTCAPGGSPLVGSCPGAITLSHSGITSGLTKTITTENGSTATVTLPTIRIDRSPPTVRVTGAVSGHTYRRTRHLRCVARDRYSGLLGRCVIETRRVTHHRKVEIRFTATAVDRAGNVTVVRGEYHLS